MSGFVHVVDDDEAVRDAVAASLAARGLRVQAHASAQQFLDALPRAVPGCVVTDVQMPGMSGLELLRRMASQLDAFPFIVLTGKADVPMAVEALKHGATDFIEKPFDGEVIFAAVAAAMERSAGHAARASERAEYLRRLSTLAPREREVLSGVVEGLSNKMIARELGISPRTVEAYRANLMVKMGAASLSELVRMRMLAEEP